MNLQPGQRAALEAKLTAKGYKAVEATVFVDKWTSSLPSEFTFKTPLPSSDAKCKSTWGTRVLKHTDWVDGSSLVQAGETPSEEGFNNRFHDIENDLDRLGASVGVAFDCVNELRAATAALANEISAHFDAIAAVIAACCERIGIPSGTGGTGGAGNFIGTLHVDEEIDLAIVQDDRGGIILFPKGGPTPVDGDGVFDPVQSRSAEFLRILTMVAEVREAFGDRSVTKDALVRRFGGVAVGGGPKVNEVVDVLPSDATFESLDKMAEGLAEAEGAAIKASKGTDAIIRGAFNKPVLSVANAPIESFATLSGEVRVALAESGIRTVGDLSHASIEQVHAALRDHGIESDPGDAGALIGGAKVMERF